ncbi:MAG TPA: Sir2 family NAD-dependent protein deacetylase [Nocardioidaceae bacterium]|nr:Sir2 family NAD-dependent protein deacetylase [Nocardioidaceae bacterium]
MTDLYHAGALVGDARRVTVLTGAGISTDSGIPDFRGPQGLWTKNPGAQAMFSLDSYVADRDVRVRAWRNRREHPAWTAKPNDGHRALVDLERQDRLAGIVTQNIDGLHQSAGSSPDLVHEIHGTIWEAICLTCWRRVPMAEVLDRVDAGEDDPPCSECDGIQKSATISFGQKLDPDVLDASLDASRRCDLFLAVGTSLQVQPAASLCGVALNAGVPLVVVNAEPTPYDQVAQVVVRDPIGEALPRLVAA